MEKKKREVRKTKEERMKEIQKKLEEGVRAIYDSDKYKDYITAMSKFPHYSINNCILIASQCPQASLVCGFMTWKKEFNRTVNKGEHGIMIMAPIKVKDKTQEPVFDENGRAVYDGNGKRVTETVEREYQTYRPVYVYDASQTSGDPLPTLATLLDEKVEDFPRIRDALIRASPVPVVFQHVTGTANGYYSPSEKKIVIDENLPQLQMVKTMIHEMGHAELKHGSRDDKWDRNTKEIQAESIAHWVSEMLGVGDTGSYSYGYISGWAKDRDVSELKDNLELIKTTADTLYQRIEKELTKERKTELKKDAESRKESASEDAVIPRPRIRRSR